MRTVQDIEKAIERAEAVIARTQPITDAPQVIPGPLATGRSNYTMGKQLDRENNRRADAFRENQKAKMKLLHLQRLLKDVNAGERHPNGQPCANAPSRQRAQAARERLDAFYRATIQPGYLVAIAFNPKNTLLVKRVNQKSITAADGIRWTFEEILLCENGKVLSAAETTLAFQKWEAANSPACESGMLYIPVNLKTPEEISDLKREWRRDPCWNLEDTEGFEGHYAELKEFSDVVHAEAAARERDRLERLAASLGIPGNLALAVFVDGLQRRVTVLEEETRLGVTSQIEIAPFFQS